MSLPTEPRLNGPVAVSGDLVNRVQQLRLDNQLGAGKRPGGGSWLPWVLCGLLAVTWAGVGIRWYKAAPAGGEGADGAAAARPAGTGPAGGAGAPAAPGEVVFALKGNLIPSLQIAVSPIDVAGEVTEITFVEGKRVKRGELLAKIRDSRYFNEFKNAEASLLMAQERLAELLPDSVRKIEKEQAQAELDEAKASWVRADQEVKRLDGLKGRVAVSPQDIERAEADLHGAAARVTRLEKAYAILVEGPRKEKIAAARAEVAAALARKDEAKRMLDNCTIPAPIEGTVLTKKADVGSLVSPAAFNVSASLCEIADLSKLEVEVDVPERQITRVRANLDCHIAADADPQRVYRGRVDRVMPIADDSKNVIKIRVQVILPPGEEPGEFLKPKMSALVTAYNRDYAPEKK
jgi:multidrug resistance efflux pump